MKKIITPREMVRIETLAYEEGAEEETFMQKAGQGVANVVKKQFSTESSILLLCSKGNNSGDAYVAGIHLIQAGFHVEAIQVTPLEQSSPLCKKNGYAFKELGGKLTVWKKGDSWPNQKFSLIIDALFGTGFHGIAKEPYASLIETVNHSNCPIYSIDIPSGLDGATGEVEGAAIRAEKTIYLSLPKLGFFLKRGWDYVGKLTGVDFGLEEKYISQAESKYQLLDKVHLNMPVVQSSRHKYQAGSVASFSGSPGMPGAAMLSSLAALRMGAGIVYLLYPNGMEKELSAAPYELIRVPYETSDPLIEMINHSDAALIGPGIGKQEKTVPLLKEVLKQVTVPSVIDADALSLIAEHQLPIPAHAILTPHRGEMARLLKIATPKEVSEEFLELCFQFSEEHQCVLILKGGPTYLFEPGKKIKISPWGCPGMATAGCGDVLTGIIAGLLAQHLLPSEAATLGTVLHGLAGEIAEKKWTSYCLIASDLLEELPQAIRSLTPLRS